MVRYEIEDGPSEMGLSQSLFRQYEKSGLTYFKTTTPLVMMGATYDSCLVWIDTLTRGSIESPCQRWIFAGKVVDTTFRRWLVVGNVYGNLTPTEEKVGLNSRRRQTKGEQPNIHPS